MRVTVLGCDYVDLELTRTFVADGHDVWGVRRSDNDLDAVEATGMETVRADVTDTDSLGAVSDVNRVVFVASSGGRGTDTARAVFVEGLRTVIDQFVVRDSPPECLVYTSSTGVYGNHGGGFVGESTSLDSTTDKTRVLVKAERITCEYAAERGVERTVTRFAGLYDSDHYWLGRYLNNPVTTGYLDIIHRDDATGVVASLPETDCARDDTVFVVDNEPVSKHGFMDWLADECDVPRPEKRMKEERLDVSDLSAAAHRRIPTSKRHSNGYLREPGYSPACPTCRGGYRAAIDAYRADSD